MIKLTSLPILTGLILIAVGGGGARADDQKTVADLDTQYQAAVKANDATTMDRILADDFILVDGDGTVSTKTDLLNEARSKRITYEHQEEREQKVRIWGPTAAVTAKLWGKGTNDGKPFEWVLWFSDTYVRTPQGWRYAFGQASLPLPQRSEKNVKVETIPPRPDDVKSPEAIVRADYECISGGIGVARQWERDFSLFDPYARSFVPYKEEKTSALAIWNPTQQEYADLTDAHFLRDGFREHEVAHKIYQYGNVATVFSSYEGTMASTGKLYSRGVNVYQLYFAGNRWWISSVSWDDENPISSIPPELMPMK
jgi:ketosteroid isomerase-like protein